MSLIQEFVPSFFSDYLNFHSNANHQCLCVFHSLGLLAHSTRAGLIPWPFEGTHTDIPKSHWKERAVGELHLRGFADHFTHRNSRCCNPAFALCSFSVRLIELSKSSLKPDVHLSSSLISDVSFPLTFRGSTCRGRSSILITCDCILNKTEDIFPLCISSPWGQV